MFIWDWFTGLLKYLGLYKKSGKILLLGLDNAGKTTLLSVLKEGHMTQPVPTLHPTWSIASKLIDVFCGVKASEELTMGGVLFTTFDLGGHQQARRVWRDYFPVVDGIVFVVDAFDRERIRESKHEFYSMLNDDQIAHIPVLILANKIDKPGAASEDEIRALFELHNKTTGKGTEVISEQRPLELFMCSVLKKQGYGEAFRWLAQYMK